jgi:hypothetical protein
VLLLKKHFVVCWEMQVHFPRHEETLEKHCLPEQLTLRAVFLLCLFRVALKGFYGRKRKACYLRISIPGFFPLDFLWLGLIAIPFYDRHLGYILRGQVLWAVKVFWKIAPLGKDLAMKGCARKSEIDEDLP